MSLDNIISIVKSKINIGNDQNEIESYFYTQLSIFLKEGDFEGFKTLLDHSTAFNIHADVKNIPNRLEIISTLHKERLLRMNTQFQSFLGDIIELLKFCYQFNLYESEDISNESLDIVEELKTDKLLLDNLVGLFGGYSTSFLHYIRILMPRELYDFMMKIYSIRIDSAQYNIFEMINSIRIHFDYYSTYGLSVLKLGTISEFLELFDEELEKQQYDKKKPEKNGLIRYSYGKKIILVSPSNIIKNRKKIKSNHEYSFYSLAMVLLGGVGPQGHGFLYSTPKGEVVEICSDRKENNAMIIKQKIFFKHIFLIKLEKQMTSLFIDQDIAKQIIAILNDTIKTNDVVDINKKRSILTKVNDILKTISHSMDKTSEFNELKRKISKAIDLIFLDIRMEDQFKARMTLLEQGKLTSEEIAKFTSLRDKSHYNVLQERFFFQHIVNWFYLLFLREYWRTWT
ncbi:MAG: hypothetical protein ACFFAS_14320 [Promethearchaeota archaeon]